MAKKLRAPEINPFCCHLRKASTEQKSASILTKSEVNLEYLKQIRVADGVIFRISPVFETANGFLVL